LDGSDASEEYLNLRFPDSRPKSRIELPETAIALISQYEEASEQEKYHAERKQEAENLLKQMIGDNEAGSVAGRVVTWKSVVQERLDSKTLKAEHPSLYKRFSNQISYRRFTVKAAS
jgi:predicted phage-related endonuclease